MDFPVMVDASLAVTPGVKRGLSSLIWKGFNIPKALANRGYGYFKSMRWDEWTDITSSTSNPWATMTQATAGTANRVDGPSGYGPMLELDSASNTTGQGINLQFKPMGAKFATGQTVFLEGFFRFNDIATGLEWFFGLSDSDTTIISSDLVTTGSKIGFSTVGTDKIIKFSMGTSAVPTISSVNVHTAIDGDVTTDGTEYFSVGLKWEVNKKVTIALNGVRVGQDVLIANDPDGTVLYPSIVSQVRSTNIDSIANCIGFDYGWTTATSN